MVHCPHMHGLLSMVTSIIQYAGPLGVFAGSVLEELISFIPSALVQVSAGFFLLQGHPLGLSSFSILFLGIGVPSALGVALGSLPYYAAGRFGGEWFVRRFGRYVGVTESKLEAVRGYFKTKKTDETFFVIARMIPLIPSVLLTVTAGVLRMRLGSFIVLSIIGTFVRASILGFVGWRLGVLAEASVSGIDSIVTAVGTVLFVGLGSWWLIRKFKPKQS